MINNRKIGSIWEQHTVKYLEEHGYKIITTNYRCRHGEIDIIARDGNYISFLEVKYRSNSSFGMAVDAVNYAKQRTIRKVASYFLVNTYHSLDIPCRFDVVAIDGGHIELIKDAF